jgi:50S ribosomal protein L16 3-hydroxylase
MQFSDFDIDGFLRDYWQKKPLLIKNPWAAWQNPVEPDDLAGLACEPEVESRLIIQTKSGWTVEHGPLTEARFGKLGKAPWTLLVQAVDHAVPDVAALIEPFRFVPNWRIDDVMVSYASDGGGVGPHFDQYDVFLIQGLGTRRWQVGPHGASACDADAALLPHDDLRLLANFEAAEEWLLEPGDILYIPPRVAHNGVAVGDDCMTYSVGFRAPSRAELIGHFADDLLAEMPDDDRYADPGLAAQSNPGEISADAVAALHAMITQRLGDRDAFARWFGAYNSTPKYPEIDWSPGTPVDAAELRARLSGGEALCRNPASRFSFMRQDASSVLLFADGVCFECSGETAAFAEMLCAHVRFLAAADVTQSDAAMQLIAQLVDMGSVAFEDGDEDDN